MTRTRWAPRRVTAAAGALATAFALAVPLAGVASATHVTNVALTPDSDVAAVNTCNEFTITVTPAQATVIDVQITQASTVGTPTTPATAAQAPNIGFCAPAAGSGPNPVTATQTTTTNPAGTTVTTANSPNCPPAGDVAGTGGGTTAQAQATATCSAEFTTNAAGQVTFGVISDTPGNMTVTAFAEEPNNPATTAPNVTGNNVPNTGEIGDVSTKTWVSSAAAAVTRIDCEPETDSNPVGTAHQFTCTVFANNPNTGQSTVPVNGVTVNYIVISGPDANQIPAACTASNAQGVSTCTLTNNGNPGTDQILGYVEQNATAGPQASEPSDQIAKTWIGRARTIDCAPNTATNPSGTSHVVTCTVRDINGQPVQGQDVAFTETGPGHFTFPVSTIGTFGGTSPALVGGVLATTDANGQVSAVTQTANNESGTQQITGQLAFNCLNAGGTVGQCRTAADRANDTGNPQECQQAAGSTVNAAGTGTTTPPAGSGTTAGNCAETVSKVWFTGPSPTATATATATATPTVTTTATTTATATATSTTTSTPPPSACVGATQANVNVAITGPTTILAGQGTTVRVTAPVNSVVQLLARTSGGTYAAVRTATVPAGGTVDFLVTPRYTTRIAARACNFTSLAQPIISVAARVSLAVTPLPGCVLRFTGGTLPVKPGQVVNIYYRGAGGAVTVAIQARTSTTGTYVAQRRFLACGRTLSFFARVNADVHNLAGQSPDRVATIRR